jgi:hypothetical protein
MDNSAEEWRRLRKKKKVLSILMQNGDGNKLIKRRGNTKYDHSCLVGNRKTKYIITASITVVGSGVI